jgi:hypothetical protein
MSEVEARIAVIAVIARHRASSGKPSALDIAILPEEANRSPHVIASAAHGECCS